MQARFNPLIQVFDFNYHNREVELGYVGNVLIP